MKKSSVVKFAKGLAIAAAVFMAPVAMASPGHHWGDRRPGMPFEKKPHQPKGDHRSVPEFDPSAGGALLALLSGGGLLIARRRHNEA